MLAFGGLLEKLTHAEGGANEHCAYGANRLAMQPVPFTLKQPRAGFVPLSKLRQI